MRWFERSTAVLGLDVGSEAIKAVEIMADRGRHRIVGFGQVEVSTKENRADALSDLLKHCGFKSRRVATAVSGRSVIVRFLDMVEIPEENIRTTLKFEADRYIPFDLQEVVLDYHRVEDAPGLAANQMRLLLVAAKRDMLQEHVQLLTAAGLQVVSVNLDAFALGNAFALGGPTHDMAAGKVVALVDVGSSKTMVNIVRGAESYFTREVYVAGKEITTAVAKKFGLEAFEGEQLKREPSSRATEVTEAVLPVLEDIGNEIHLSFEYYENQSESKVEEVFVSGGGSRVPGIEEVFERVFERRTVAWNPIEGFDTDSGSIDQEALLQCAPALGVAAGLGIRA